MACFLRWLSVVAWLLVAVVPMFPAGSEEVWALRSRFTVTISDANIEYAEEDAQWRIMFRDGYIAANDVGFAIEFTDGRVLHNTDLTHDRTERSVIETPFGEATRCHVRFKAQDGAVVEHFLTLFRDRPFVLLGMAVTNTGDTPLTVTRFVPVRVKAIQFPGLGPSTEVTRYPLRIQGGEPVFDPDGPPTWTRFHDPATKRTVAIGLLPSDGMGGGTEFSTSGDGWEGEAFFDHAPGTELAPGARTETGSVWLAAGVTEPDQMALYYGWAFTVGRDGEKRTDAPRAWVTVSDGESLNDLLKIARTHESGIRYALIPASWEGRPGSMRGAAPGYPGDMSSAANQLSAMGITPGIALDPLAGDGGNEDWVVRSADGQAWLNPEHTEAAKVITKRVNQAVRWGFGFIAVAPSAIPDEALDTMDLTRAKANTLALYLTRDAAGAVPVVVAGSGIPARTVADWRIAADAAKVMTDYGAAPAAMRVDADALGDLTEENTAALRDWAGPIEVVGAGKTSVRHTLSQDVFAGRGGPPPRMRPAKDAGDAGAENAEEPDESEAAPEAVAEENGDTVVLGVEQPKEPEKGNGLFRGIKNLGRSIF